MGCKRRDRQEGSAKMKDLEAMAAEIGAMLKARGEKIAIAESSSGFFASHVDGIDECCLGVNNAHTTTTTTASCFNDDWIAHLLGSSNNFFWIIR